MRRARGFTLVEVLVALVIVAVGMGALLAALGAAADNTSYLRDKTFAQWVALNRVAEVRLQAQLPTKGKQSGETDFAGHKWQWEQEVTSLDVPGVLRIDIRTRIADTTPAKNAPWMGNAIGVVGDAIMRNLSPLATAARWESTPELPDKGDTGGVNNDTNNNSNIGATPNNGDTNDANPPPPPLDPDG